MFSVSNLKVGKAMAKERIAASRSTASNMYLYPAMMAVVKSIRRNHGKIVDPSDGSTAKVKAVVETADGQIGAWLGVEHFAICKVNIIRGLPVVTSRLLNDARNVGSIEKSISRYNEDHDCVIVSWIAI